MRILKDLPDLVKAEVISQETATQIKDYYQKKDKQSPNRLFIVFGIFGAILTGLGIILLVAHNWDELSRAIKTFFAFLPLLVAQVICGYILIKKRDNITLKESSAAFLFLAVGASIALVTQIYHIPGSMSSFLSTWMLLCLPLIYIMQSSIASMFYLIGITYFACETGYFSDSSTESYLYWLLLIAAFPYYFLLYKKKPNSNFTIFHNWLLPLSLVITLGTIAENARVLIDIAYFNLFGIFYLIGSFSFLKNQRQGNNGYKIIGSIGMVFLLLYLSYDDSWYSLRTRDFHLNDLILSPEFLASFILTILILTILYIQYRGRKEKDADPFAFAPLLFLIIYFIGFFSSLSVVLINLIVFTMGILVLMDGVKRDHLGIVNYGLLIILALATCRFFDTDLSFAIRGVLFLLTGVGFFATNYWMLKRRKING